MGDVAVPGEPNSVRPAILSVTPATIDVSGGRASTTPFTVAYEIRHVEGVEKAEIRLHAPGLGDVFTTPVDVVEKGLATFEFDSGTHDFGPTIRVRATCPEGTTEWYTLGRDPSLPAPFSPTALRILSAGPGSIPRPSSEFAASNWDQLATRVTIRGAGLTAACTPEADVDGSPVEILSVGWRGTYFEGTIANRHIGRPMSPRYLELKLSLDGPGVGVVAIHRVPFTE